MNRPEACALWCPTAEPETSGKAGLVQTNIIAMDDAELSARFGHRAAFAIARCRVGQLQGTPVKIGTICRPAPLGEGRVETHCTVGNDSRPNGRLPAKDGLSRYVGTRCGVSLARI